MPLLSGTTTPGKEPLLQYLWRILFNIPGFIRAFTKFLFRKYPAQMSSLLLGIVLISIGLFFGKAPEESVLNQFKSWFYAALKFLALAAIVWWALNGHSRYLTIRLGTQDVSTRSIARWIIIPTLIWIASEWFKSYTGYSLWVVILGFIALVAVLGLLWKFGPRNFKTSGIKSVSQFVLLPIGKFILGILALIVINMAMANAEAPYDMWNTFYKDHFNALVWANLTIIMIGLASAIKTGPPDKRVIHPFAGAVRIFLVFFLFFILVVPGLQDHWRRRGGTSYRQARAAVTPNATPTTQTTVVGMENILRQVVCKPESGCRHTDDNGNVIIHENIDGSKDIGYYQFNDKTWLAMAKDVYDLDLYEEEDQHTFARIVAIQLGLGLGPWIKNFHKWGNEIGEPIHMVVYAKPEGYSTEILMPDSPGKLSPVGNGKKYRIRYRGDKATVERDLPRIEGATNVDPGKVLAVQVMSRESEDVEINLMYRPQAIIIQSKK